MTTILSLPVKARLYALVAHAGHFRRDGVTPYSTHVEDVAKRVEAAGGTPTQIAVAWLHDVVEDTEVTLEELRLAGFPEDVLTAVDLLTKKGCDYLRYIDDVRSNADASAVKWHDIYSNLADQPTPAQVMRYARALKALS